MQTITIMRINPQKRQFFILLMQQCIGVPWLQSQQLIRIWHQNAEAAAEAAMYSNYFGAEQHAFDSPSSDEDDRNEESASLSTRIATDFTKRKSSTGEDIEVEKENGGVIQCGDVVSLYSMGQKWKSSIGNATVAEDLVEEDPVEFEEDNPSLALEPPATHGGAAIAGGVSMGALAQLLQAALAPLKKANEEQSRAQEEMCRAQEGMRELLEQLQKENAELRKEVAQPMQMM
jgi:hypothetical protein